MRNEIQKIKKYKNEKIKNIKNKINIEVLKTCMILNDI